MTRPESEERESPFWIGDDPEIEEEADDVDFCGHPGAGRPLPDCGAAELDVRPESGTPINEQWQHNVDVLTQRIMELEEKLQAYEGLSGPQRVRELEERDRLFQDHEEELADERDRALAELAACMKAQRDAETEREFALAALERLVEDCEAIEMPDDALTTLFPHLDKARSLLSDSDAR